jgi:hypothetical protein
MERKKLSDILSNSRNWMDGNWGDIPPAPDFGNPIPRGEYIAHIRDGELFRAGTGTPGYKLTFEILEGDHEGRRCWYDIWLTDAAKRQAVRDLAKIGIRDKAQLEQPIPRWIRCRIRVTIERSDQGDEQNRVKTFEVVGIDPPEPEPFAPAAPREGGAQ